jgi:hypothetical protein
MEDGAQWLLKAISDFIGYDITPLAPFVAGVLIFGTPLAIFILKMRQRLADLNTLTANIRSATADVSSDVRTNTKQEIDDLLGRFTQLHNDLKATMADRIDALQAYLKPTEEVKEAIADSEVEEEQSTKQPKQRKLQLAQQVRNAVIQKWLEGEQLRRTESDPNCYEFNGLSGAGEKIRLLLLTPYRKSLGEDGRLNFALDVWVNNKKHLNFEWGAEGQYALRGFKRGDWIAEVSEWTIVGGTADEARAA